MLFTKKAIVYLLLFYMPVTLVGSQNADSDFIQTWKITYIDGISLSEKQLLANMIYLVYANAIIEYKISQFSTPIARLHQSIRNNVTQYKNIIEDATMLKTLLERLVFLVNARTIYHQMLDACLTYYSAHTTHSMSIALESLELYAQTILRSLGNEKSKETALQLKKSSTDIQNTLHYFQEISQVYKEMSEDKLPIPLSSENEQNKSLIMLSIPLKNNLEALNVIDMATNSLNKISDYSWQIISGGIQIYKEFYTILYNTLMATQYDKSYMTGLFSVSGIMPNEHRSLLPHPDGIFEHVLQTAKTYIKEELSHS